MNSSESEQCEEEVANYVRACDSFPTFDLVESIVGPFRRNMVQSPKP